jgi:PAS domain S-box-containing protein
MNATAIYDANGKYQMSRSTLLDNTLRKQAEDALRESQASLQNFLDTASDLIQSVDEAGNYLYVNNAWCETLGYAPEEARGLSMLDIVDPDHLEYCKTMLHDLLTLGRQQKLEMVFRTKQGKKVVVDGSLSRHTSHDGHSFSSGFFRDVTERKEAEDALRASDAKLRLSSEELIQANLALEKAARLKDEFLASMSHELRTPLTGILGLSEVLQMNTYGALSERQLKALKTIENSGRHLLALINDILDLSKIEAGKLEMQFETCSVEEICQSSLQLVKGMSSQKRQKISYSIAPASMVVRADARRMKQTLVNLLSNAIKFTPEQGELGLEVVGEPDLRLLHFKVWDKGIGIAAEDMGKLFKPFSPVDSSLSRSYSGTGLGLSLVQRLVEMHGGRISLESTPGQGSTFSVSIPWQPPVNPIPAENERPLFRTIGNKPSAPSRGIILLAEDNPVNIMLMTDYLSARGYDVVLAQNGVEAVQKTVQNRPHLILMDIQMPGMDGLEATRRIRSLADRELSAIPIIAVTALAMAGDRERCMEAGANGYMSKPINLDGLVNLMEELLS